VKNKIRAAAIQMCSTPDRHLNLAVAHRLLKKALAHKPHIVALPESFSFLSGRSAELRAAAEPLNGVTAGTLQEWAAEYGIWLHGGSIFLKARDGKITNTTLLIAPDGTIAARYDKIHLFDASLSADKAAYKESSVVKPGRRPGCARTPLGVMGLSICYDIRFPELYRKLADAGAHIIFIPAAFTVPSGQAHWDTLTRARAIENQAFVIAPAQTLSPYPGRRTYGHTRIVDPWGRVLAEMNEGPGVVAADLDFDDLNRIRSELPALRHRRI